MKPVTNDLLVTSTISPRPSHPAKSRRAWLSSFLIFAGCCSWSMSYGQDCLNYYFLQNNKTVEMAIYDKKGKPQAKQVYTITNVSNSGGSATGEVATEMFDKNGKSMAKGASKIRCNGGVMMVDMKMSMPMQPGQNYEADVKAEDFFLEYPSAMKVGDQLKDASMHMTMESASGLTQTVDMEMKDRKVVGQEKITTPAGSWDCFKITYKGKMRIKMGIGIPVNLEGTEWFAPGFGIVKTESKQGGTEIVAIR